MELSDLDRDQLLETFLAETEEQLAEMEEGLVALEASSDDGDSLEAIFRAAHTLKGNAASMGFSYVAEVAHGLEDLLDRLRTHKVDPSDEIVTLLLRAVDVVRGMFRAVDVIRGVAPESASVEPGTDYEQLLQDLAAAGEASVVRAAPTPEDPGSTAYASPTGGHTLRVDIGRLDRMLNLSGEIAVARGRLTQMLSAPGASGPTALIEAHREADRIFLDLQEEILRVRMVPVGPAFRQQLRTVRDGARASGKLARLAIEGDDVEVDTTLIEQIRGPLTHMVRNAVDHGIEKPGVRAERGKDPEGLVTLRARHEGGSVILEVTDDGGGLDRERIALRALERGLVTSSEGLTEDELLRLVFKPGFTTAETVTELSGRGVGMDVVHRNVEALRGSVAVESRPGVGTTFRIRLPLTVAIIEGFLVGAGTETYVIPLEAVLECVDLPDQGVGPVSGGGVISLRGEAVPYLRLREAFALAGHAVARESLVVVSHAGRRVALAVDALLGEGQVVIKPFGRLLKGLPGIAGSTILGTGRVALILDVPALIHWAKRQASARTALPSRPGGPELGLAENQEKS